MSTPSKTELAEAILTMAAEGEMPDSYWLTDSRVALAAGVLKMSTAEARDWARANCVRTQRYG